MLPPRCCVINDPKPDTIPESLQEWFGGWFGSCWGLWAGCWVLVGCLGGVLGSGGVLFRVCGWCGGACSWPAGWFVVAVVVFCALWWALQREGGDVVVDAGEVRCAGVVGGQADGRSAP